MRLKRQRGFSYLIALFMVALLAILSLRGLQNTAMKERRDKEAELLFVGQEYRNAIKMYYDNTPGSVKQFPPDIKSLLEDGRTTRMNRPLRKLYLDPMTNSDSWGVVPGPNGGVMGVYSLSTQIPVKTDGFPVELMSFTNAKQYQEWKFIYQPN